MRIVFARRCWVANLAIQTLWAHRVTSGKALDPQKSLYEGSFWEAPQRYQERSWGLSPKICWNDISKGLKKSRNSELMTVEMVNFQRRNPSSHI